MVSRRFTAGGAALARIPLLVAATMLAGAVAVAAPAHAADAQLTSTNPVSTYAGQSVQQVPISVPDGLTPSRVTAQIVTSGTPAGTIRATINGRVILAAPAAALIKLDAALLKTDVVDNQLLLGLEYLTPANSACTVVQSSAQLNQLAVTATGNEVQPNTVGEFFPASVPAVVLSVPQNPSADVSNAVLSATTAMAHRYPDATISVVPQTDLAARSADLPAGGRIITLAAGTLPVTTSITEAADKPELVMTGSGPELAAAATALGDDRTALANSAKTSGLTSTLPASPGLNQTLKSLGASAVHISGYGTSESYIGINQSQFGGPVSSVSVHLAGTHTAIPANAQAQVSVFWNDYLLGSRVLGTNDGFSLDAVVPEGQIQAGNGLRIQLAALPAGGNCKGSAGQLPMDLTLDTTSSTVTAVRGNSLEPGFARFPQVLGQNLAVAFDAGNTAQANTVNAAKLAAALQAGAAQQLNVSVTDLSTFIGSSASGLVVGATSKTAEELSSPLRLGEFRTVDSGAVEFGVGTSTGFGVLQAFEQDHRNVLMLGAWTPESDAKSAATLQNSLSDYIQSQPGGWSTLSRNLLVTQPSGKPALLESNSVIPQAQATNDYRAIAWWVAAAVVVLIGALMARTVLLRRRRLAAAYVDAEQASDAAQTPSAD